MQLWTHPACLLHDTGPGHAERPERLAAVLEALREAFPDMPWHEAPRATRGQLLRVHADSLLATVLDTHSPARVHLDPDTVLSPASAEAGLRAAGSVVAATDAVLHGQDRRRAFCAVRSAASAEAGDNTVSGSRCTRAGECVSSTEASRLASCTRSNCPRVARGASNHVTSGNASRKAPVTADNRSGRSAWPGPVSCNRQARCVQNCIGGTSLCAG